MMVAASRAATGPATWSEDSDGRGHVPRLPTPTSLADDDDHEPGRG